MAKVLVNKLGVFGSQLSWWSVGRDQLTRNHFAVVSCHVSNLVRVRCSYNRNPNPNLILIKPNPNQTQELILDVTLWQDGPKCHFGTDMPHTPMIRR